jgi:hypothetical protein
VLAYKALAAVSSLVLILLVWRAASLRGLSPVRAAVLVGLNPVIVLYGVGGHDDLMVLAILAAALYVLIGQRERRGGALIVTATAVKLTGLLLPFALAGRCRGERSARLRVALGATLGAVAWRRSPSPSSAPSSDRRLLMAAVLLTGVGLTTL